MVLLAPGNPIILCLRRQTWLWKFWKFFLKDNLGLSFTSMPAVAARASLGESGCVHTESLGLSPALFVIKCPQNYKLSSEWVWFILNSSSYFHGQQLMPGSETNKEDRAVAGPQLDGTLSAQSTEFEMLTICLLLQWSLGDSNETGLDIRFWKSGDSQQRTATTNGLTQTFLRLAVHCPTKEDNDWGC